MKGIARFCGIILAMCCLAKLQAQQLAYVYIQGDKQTPFYVKLEGTMMERYGKNYCILPQMAPGPANIEILFQQNTIPSRKFTILVPEGSSRGFLITSRNGQYSLYDLRQHFYLPAGNTAEDDHLPATTDAVAATATNDPEEVPEIITPSQPAVQEAPKQEKKQKPVKEKKQLFKPAAKTKEKATDDNELKFINNIELNNDRNTPVAGTAEEKSQTAATDTPVVTERRPLARSFQNSDCPKAMEDAAFEVVYKAMMQKSTDEDRIEYLDRQMDKCYLTWHARTLGSMLTEDAARYTFLKKVYPRISDQQEFPLLDDLLKSEVWKAQFQQLIHH